MDPNAPVAPAQPVEPPPPPTISAERDAAAKGDLSAFLEADASARQGKPLPRVEAPPVEEAPPAPGQPPRQVSKRQQQINDYERQIAETREELKALKAQFERPAPPARQPEPPAPPPGPKTPEWKRYAALPDAPKLNAVNPDGTAMFSTLEEHAAAMALFIADARYEERATAARQQADREQATTSQSARLGSFQERLQAAQAADPTFATKLSDEVKALHGYRPEEPPSPRTFIGEQVYDSPVVDRLLLHFSEHPEALRALETMPPAITAIPSLPQRIAAHQHHIVREFAKLEARLESTAGPTDPETPPASRRPSAPAPDSITAAPPPAPILSRPGRTVDPQKAAISRGDFAAFDAIEQQKMRSRFAPA